MAIIGEHRNHPNRDRNINSGVNRTLREMKQLNLSTNGDGQYKLSGRAAMSLFLNTQLDQGRPSPKNNGDALSMKVLQDEITAITAKIDSGELTGRKATAAKLQLGFYKKLLTLDTNGDGRIELTEFNASLQGNKFSFNA